MNRHKVSADVLAIVHALFILLTLTIFVLSLTQGFELYGTIWFLFLLTVWIIWKKCPLLIWEKRLRQKHDPETVYKDDFTTHYVRKFFHLNLPDRVVIIFTIVMFTIILTKLIWK